MTDKPNETHVTVGDGKYTVVLRDDGTSTALRYGDTWVPYEIGGVNNLEAALAYEVIDLRAKLAAFDWCAGLYDGRELTRDDVATELADLKMIAEEVGKVYCHVTGHRVSKPNTLASAVIAVSDDYFTEMVAEEIKDSDLFSAAKAIVDRQGEDPTREELKDLEVEVNNLRGEAT